MNLCGTCRHWDRPTDDTIGEISGPEEKGAHPCT